MARAFRVPLERGGSQHAMALYKAFRGKEPSVEPLLKARGLKEVAGAELASLPAGAAHRRDGQQLCDNGGRRWGIPMVDIVQQTAHWRDGAREDWQVATELLQNARVRHALFFAHLALEKALKAHVCRHTRDLAPRTHNLVRLAEIAGLTFSPGRTDVLAEMNEFALAGRYPGTTAPMPTLGDAKTLEQNAREVFDWLIQQL